MSYSIDTNILLYASDEGSADYPKAREFLEGRAQEPDLLCLTWPVLMGYQRMATHPSIFRQPLSPEKAWGNVEELLRLNRCRVIGELAEFAQDYSSVNHSMPIRGNFVPDAHLATILRQHGVRTIYSADADFLKFTFLKVINPLQLPPKKK